MVAAGRRERCTGVVKGVLPLVVVVVVYERWTGSVVDGRNW